MQTKKLNLFSATSIVVGSMIGSGIFIVSADIGRAMGSPFLMLVTWFISGMMMLIAAVSYAELAGMFPKSGGQYQYMKEAYNDMVGFLFGWVMFLVIQCGTIAAVAVGFAKFASVLLPMFSPENTLFHIGSIPVTAEKPLAIFSLIIITFINTRGLRTGEWVQNVFTVVKVASFLLLFALAFLICRNPEVVALNFSNFFNNPKSTGELSLLTIGSTMGVVMVGSLFSSESWNNVSFIAGEVENPKRNVGLAMGLGVFIVTVFYMICNLAYLCVLPFWGDPNGTDVLSKGIQHATQDRVGVAAFTAMLGAGGTLLMTFLIAISTFGCNNGQILSGARIYQSMAEDNLFFSKMKNLNSKGVPEFSLWAQCVWTCVLCLSGKYNDLLDYVIFVVMIFYILTIYGIFRLRKSRPELERPYKAWGYPFVPALYIILASLFTVNIIFHKPAYTVPGLVIVLLGIPAYYFWKKK